MKVNSKILLVYTGGTIGMVKDYDTGSLYPFNFEKLADSIPEITQLDCEVDSVSFAHPIDSSDMNPSHWAELARIIADAYQTHDGFVVLHGSDTMSYTASALSYMLRGLDKPVIFTGSQLPIGDLRTDAKENLITAIQIAALKRDGVPVVREVGLYFEYKLYRGNRTTKINAEHFQAFSSPNYPHLAESGVHLKIFDEYLLKRKPKAGLEVCTAMDTNVAILKLFPGFQESLIEGILTIPGLKAVVLETYGAGNVPTSPWLYRHLEKAIARGIQLVNVTQCSGGSIMMGAYATSRGLLKLGVIDGRDITTEAAITKLMFLLGQGVEGGKLKAEFERDLRGELTEFK